MTLDTYFQISVSVFCSVAVVAMLVFFVFAIMLRVQINRLLRKLTEISEIAKTTAGDTKAFVDRSIESLESFRNNIFTFEFIGQIISRVIELMQNNSKRTRKRSR